MLSIVSLIHTDVCDNVTIHFTACYALGLFLINTIGTRRTYTYSKKVAIHVCISKIKTLQNIEQEQHIYYRVYIRNGTICHCIHGVSWRGE